MSKIQELPFVFHPRAITALGRDLVTNDLVAVVELVKNSYDALATEIEVSFQKKQNGLVLSVADNGTGMTLQEIKDHWTVIATPHKELKQTSKSENKVRRVVGEKGLGRLSSARLGDRLFLLTKSRGEKCFRVDVDWSSFSDLDLHEKPMMKVQEDDSNKALKKTGTRIEISALRSEWDEATIEELRENLARLLSPFEKSPDVSICLRYEKEDASGTEVKLDSPSFLKRPKYSIKGEFTRKHELKIQYQYRPIGESISRRANQTINWAQLYSDFEQKSQKLSDRDKSRCGPFEFEIRAWEIDAGATTEISEAFGIQKSQIRAAIRSHKGLSVYRDGVLVLPKSENAKDWLGLDLRRVSRVGSRLSTSQIVGFVNITGEKNPNIKDTSDRERLVSNREVTEFEEILMAAVGLLENERDRDKIKREVTTPKDLFADLSTDDLLEEITSLKEEGADPSETVKAVEKFAKKQERAKANLEERLTHYSRLATIGAIAAMLVHEIRTRTMAFGRILDFFNSRFGPFTEEKLKSNYQRARDAIDALEGLATRFNPLANRSFKRGKRNACVEDCAENAIELARGVINPKKIHFQVPNSRTEVKVDPGELDTIFLNLITNSIYWLNQKEIDRTVQIKIVKLQNNRARVFVHDNGPGIHEEDHEQIFLPGVTKRPTGVGMGLTVTAELVAAYGGTLSIKHPGTLGGATFLFDLPCK